MINFPSGKSIHRIIREADMTRDGLHLADEVCPISESADFNTETIAYDVLGPATGLTSPHELDTPARLVKPRRLKHVTMETAYWRDASIIGEKDALRTRKLGATDENEGLADLVDRRVDKLHGRLMQRREQLTWDMFGTGIIDVDNDGVKVYRDYGIPASQKLATGTELGAAWSDPVNGDPQGDVTQVMSHFTKTSCTQVHMYCNEVTSGWVMQNKGFKAQYSGHPIIMELNNYGAIDLLARQVGGRLKKGVVHDGSYIGDDNSFTKFIPDGRVILLGMSVAGQEPLAEFASTPHTYHGGGQGIYASRIDKMNDDPPHYKIVAGIHGLPVLYRIDWVVILTVNT